MAEQELNGPQISGAGFEKMDGECVSQRMRRHRFGETSQTMGLVAGRLYRVLRDGPIVTNAWE